MPTRTWPTRIRSFSLLAALAAAVPALGASLRPGFADPRTLGLYPYDYALAIRISDDSRITEQASPVADGSDLGVTGAGPLTGSWGDAGSIASSFSGFGVRRPINHRLTPMPILGIARPLALSTPLAIRDALTRSGTSAAFVPDRDLLDAALLAGGGGSWPTPYSDVAPLGLTEPPVVPLPAAVWAGLALFAKVAVMRRRGGRSSH